MLYSCQSTALDGENRMRAAVLTIVFGCLSIIAADPQAQTTPAQLKIKTQTVASLVGRRVQLFVLLTNLSNRPIEVDKEYDADGVDRNYRFDLAIDGGTELEAES